MSEWGDAGTKVGIEIWRIEKLKPVRQDPATYGKFYSGDSYIVLHTKKRNNAFSWDIHFWLGSESSQDEMGVAAYKTVELDDSLGGGPVQYREVQGHESQMFMSLFKGGIAYLDGGIESGFRKVDREAFETRLLHLKGKRNVRVNPVPIKRDSLNEGDVFVLDAGRTIYQWNGKEASRMEKFKGMEVSGQIKDQDRGGKATVIVFDQGKEESHDAAAAADFWKLLGGKGKIRSAEEGGDDAAHEGSDKHSLYQVSDASGDLKVEKVADAPLKKEMLDSDDCFIVDCDTEIFVWVGKGATKQERKESMVHASQYLQQSGKPAYTPITRVAEGGESPLFKEKFASWPAAPRRAPAAASSSSSGASSSAAPSKGKGKASDTVNVSALHATAGPEKQRMVDDGSGKITAWRIENFKKEPVPANSIGQFFQGDSYILLYTYKDSAGREAFIIYFWLGADSSTDERGSAALLTKELDDELSGQATQVRVVQNKEPDHFLALFKGRMIVHDGGHASGFKNVKDEDSYDTDGVSLFHVRGTNALNTRAIQVAEQASSLNSGDAFVLLTPDTMFIWFGKGCNKDEQDVARKVAGVLQHDRKLLEVPEGSEPDEFWAAIGGQGEYASEAHLQDEPREPRLFQCSNASGKFSVEEIFNFDQDDLANDDVFMLDTYNEVYVWVGDKSNAEEKKKAMEVAVDYVAHATDGRDPDTPILRVYASNEPKLFTCHFIGWSEEKAKAKEDPYAKKLRELEGQKGVESVHESLKAYSDDRVIPYETLLKRPLPEGVDASKLETYLSDEEFLKVFKGSKADYAKLPKWKRDTQKKQAKLW